MDCNAFDPSRVDAYEKEAGARWGDTAAFKEYKKKTAGQSAEEQRSAGDGLLAILAAFGGMKGKPASAPEARVQVKVLQDYITAHFYTCTDEILAGLGQLYAAGGEFTEAIDRAGGPGAAAFAARAIACYCGR